MPPLIQRIVHFLLLRGGPQDLPWSPMLTLQAVLLLGAVVWVGLSLLPDRGQAAPAPAHALFAMVTVVLWPWLALRLRRWPERTTQAVLAFAGTGVLFVLMSLPLQWVASQLVPVGPPDAAATAQTLPVLLVSLAMVVLMVWKLRVDAHLWEHILEIPRLPALVLALALALSELLLISAMAASMAA